MQSLGRYELLEQLGQGTMGAVYKARDPIMDRDVAIKRILLNAIEGPEAAEFRERFFLEARAAGRLAHPGIVTVFDVSEHEGTPFLIMEYVAGRTLQSLLQSGERMDLERVCDLGIQLAEALDYAHRNGVIHRDIKPANILVTPDGRSKITDFGIAKLVESQLTSTGKLLGTPAFMVPEQFTGMPLDRRADLFALGVVIYCMATGEKPFSGETIIGVQYKVVHTDAVPARKLNPAIPQVLDAVILKSIQKDPSQRYQSGEEFARDLQACLAGEATIAQPAPSKSTDDPAAGNRTDERTVFINAKPAHGTAANGSSAAGRGRSGKRWVLFASFLIGFLVVAGFAFFSSVTKVPNPPDVIAAAPAPPPPALISSVNDLAKPSVEKVAPAKPDSFVPDEPVTARAERIEKPRNDYQQSARAVASVSPAPEPEIPPGPVGPAPEPPALETPLPLPAATDQRKPDPLFRTAKLVIMSPGVPEPLTIIVSVDNEVFFRRQATIASPAGFEDREGRIHLRTIPLVPLLEERSLPPGKHKIQVYFLLAARRVGRVQDVSDRFSPGQRRTLQIEFSPDNRDGDKGRDAGRVSITLK